MKRWMYLALGIVVVVVIVVVAVRAPGPELPNGENDVPDVVNDVPDNDVPDVATATSLQFRVEWTNDITQEWTYMAKDMGTDDLKVRWEGTMNGDEQGFIMNEELQNLWYLEDNEWIYIDIPPEFWESYRESFEAYTTALHEWTHGEWTHTDPATGAHVRIYDIQVNPTLSDALFEP